MLNRNGSRRPLVAIVGAAGTPLAFRSLARSLGPDQPIIVLQQHGMVVRGRPDRSIEAAARRFEPTLDQMGVSSPYPLIGHSVGGLIAYELAARLIDRGDTVELLMILDGAVGDSPTTPISATSAFKGASDDGWSSPWRTVRWLANGTVRRVRRKVRVAVAGLRPARTQRDLDAFHDIAMAAARRYRPRPLGADLRPVVVHVANSSAADRWSAVMSVDTLEVGGGHLTMLHPPHVRAIAEAITNRVDLSAGGSRWLHHQR